MNRYDPPFFEGQRLGREEFHRLYETTPDDFRAELIDGVVYFKGRVGVHHATSTANFVGWTCQYELRTPGIQGGLRGSTALDDLSEVHPDVSLRIKPERGGQTYKLGDIIGGAPELIIEVADESRTIDLGPKLAIYERSGVQEYVVHTLEPEAVHWHIRRGERLVRLDPDADGLHRSVAFPGLWLDPVGLIANDSSSLLATVERGTASPEHAEFVARLAAIRP